jgi:hypothetical protein
MMRMSNTIFDYFKRKNAQSLLGFHSRFYHILEYDVNQQDTK